MDGMPDNMNIDKEGMKQRLMASIQESGVDPASFVRIGEMAKQVIKSPDLYPILVDFAVSNGIAGRGDLGNQIDYKNIGLLMAMGKLASEMMGQQPGA